ncbi:MAG: hypothetical protein JW731_14745 [Bacteroidales bacterium]|nr:hypothetical protein [Bacteroidales bacterium]
MKIRFSILIILLSIFLSGCIELVEEIKINSDTSGSMTYTLEFNGISKIFSEVSRFTDTDWREQLENEAGKLVAQLQTKHGISNIQFIRQNYTNNYELSFDFENTKYLNAALYEMGGHEKSFFSPGYIKIKKHRFRRINFSPWVRKYLENEQIEIPLADDNGILFYKSIIHFPTTIKGISDKSVQISSDGKVATGKYDIQKILKNEVKTGLKVKY